MRTLKIRWTCSNYAKHEHNHKWQAYLCGKKQKLQNWLRWNHLGYTKKNFAQTRILWLWLIGLEWNQRGVMLITRRPFAVVWSHQVEFSFEDKKLYWW